MKALIVIFTILFILVGIGLTGCYKDVVLPVAGADPNAPPKQYSFSKDIAPLLNTDCAKAGCHVAGSQTPDMEAGVSYNALVNGGFVNTTFPSQSIIYQELTGNMEEHMPLATDREKVYDWIRTGALNN